MLRPRVIPVLLIKDGLLYKTKKFKTPQYIGDPINSVKIFNEKLVDELIVLDIDASKKNRVINFELINSIASETFMPLTYGGGIHSIEDARKIFALGVEKIALNSYALERPEIITELQKEFGSQSIVVAIDIKKNLFNNYQLYTHSATKKSKLNLLEYIQSLEVLGAGEVLVNLVDHDGMRNGYNIELMKSIAQNTSLPVIALGGARGIEDIQKILHHVSAAAAGSIFVYQGKHDAVLITYFNESEINLLMDNKQQYGDKNA